MSLTQLSAQQSKEKSDTSKCYNLAELQKLATILTDCEACDTLLNVAYFKIKNREELIKEKQDEIYHLNNQHFLKDQIIKEKESTIESLTNDVESLTTQRTFLTIGWGSTTVLLGGLLFLSIMR
jgi:predicted nucleotide-binding protein